MRFVIKGVNIYTYILIEIAGLCRSNSFLSSSTPDLMTFFLKFSFFIQVSVSHKVNICFYNWSFVLLRS